jgi:hypothetical protein
MTMTPPVRSDEVADSFLTCRDNGDNLSVKLFKTILEEQAHMNYFENVSTHRNPGRYLPVQDRGRFRLHRPLHHGLSDQRRRKLIPVHMNRKRRMDVMSVPIFCFQIPN